MISAIVAKAHRNVIGKANDLPWYLPADLRHFKELTTGHPVIMGRKTFESIIARLGKPLPDRRNIVVTRDADYQAEGAEIVHSLQEALDKVQTEDAFIIGGAQLYQQAIDLIEQLFITEVDADIDGDVFFPEIDMTIWKETAREHHDKDDRNQYDYDFVTLVRR